MTKITLHKVKRKRGSVWMLRWYDSRGRRCGETIGKVGVMTKRQAEAIRRDRQGKTDNGLATLDRPERMTLADFIEHDQETIKPDVKGATLHEYKLAWDHAKAAIGGEALLTRIGWAEVSAVKQRLVDRGCRTATIRKTIVTLRATFNRALKQGYVITNPFAEQRLPKVQSKQKRIYTHEEVAYVVKAAPDLWWEAFITLAVTSGLRKSELLNLTWRDIDFDAKTVTVSAKRAATFKVGDIEYPILAWSAKSDQERSVPIPDDTLALLQRLQVKSGGSLYVFVSLARLQTINHHIESGALRAKMDLVNNLLRQFIAIQVQARKLLAEHRRVKVEKVDWPLGCLHDLRRTFCTWTAETVKMSTLQKWAGHEDISTTAVYYCDTTADEADRQRKAMAVSA
ncbi:MAG: tyrosine-type recombinase/integrase [Phycisphaerales bacterium]